MSSHNYDNMFKFAKQNAVYNKAMAHIKVIVNDEKQIEEEQFKTIKEIIEAASKHLEPEEE